MITDLAAAAADCNAITWADVAFIGVLGAALVGGLFVFLKWR